MNDVRAEICVKSRVQIMLKEVPNIIIMLAKLVVAVRVVVNSY